MDTTHQNHRQPKRKPKTLKPISATGQNQPELVPAEKVLPNENDENLKTSLLKKIWNQNANLKNATIQAGTYFYDLKTVAAKNGFAFYLQLKTKLVLQTWFCICSWVA